MITITELDKIREKTLNKIGMRVHKESSKVIVGMGEIGIEAGAREVLVSFVDEIQNKNLDHIDVLAKDNPDKTGLEPIVDVIDGSGKEVRYVNMTPEKALKVLNEHILNGYICSDYTEK